MNARERFFAALTPGETPDRVPTHAIYLDGNLVDQVLGKPQMCDFDLIDVVRRQFPDDEDFLSQLNSSVAALEADTFKRVVEAGLAIGLDAVQVGVLYLQFVSEKEFTDVFGRRYAVVNNHGHAWPYYTGGTIKTEEQWREEVQKPILENWTQHYSRLAKRFFRQVTRAFRNEKSVYVCVTNDIMGIWESAWQGMGMAAFGHLLRKKPEFVQEVFDAYADFTIAVYLAYVEAGARVFVTSEDLAFKGRPMMSPKVFEEMLVPCYRRLTDAIHEAASDSRVVLHTDGQITPLLEGIVRAGFDGLHSLEPEAGVDLALVKKKVGDRLALLGNVDTGHVLSGGTREEVESAVRAAICAAGGDGNFVVSPANMHPAVRVENLRWMVEAAKKWGKYPLSA
ncbi:MAG: hypothetical protein Kow0069_22460 [Promethearchaeota archaeon]